MLFLSSRLVFQQYYTFSLTAVLISNYTQYLVFPSFCLSVYFRLYIYVALTVLGLAARSLSCGSKQGFYVSEKLLTAKNALDS